MIRFEWFVCFCVLLRCTEEDAVSVVVLCGCEHAHTFRSGSARSVLWSFVVCFIDCTCPVSVFSVVFAGFQYFCSNARPEAVHSVPKIRSRGVSWLVVCDVPWSNLCFVVNFCAVPFCSVLVVAFAHVSSYPSDVAQIATRFRSGPLCSVVRLFDRVLFVHFLTMHSLIWIAFPIFNWRAATLRTCSQAMFSTFRPTIGIKCVCVRVFLPSLCAVLVVDRLG